MRVNGFWFENFPLFNSRFRQQRSRLAEDRKYYIHFIYPNSFLDISSTFPPNIPSRDYILEGLLSSIILEFLEQLRPLFFHRPKLA